MLLTTNGSTTSEYDPARASGQGESTKPGGRRRKAIMRWGEMKLYIRILPILWNVI